MSDEHTDVYRAGSNAFVHTPGVYRWAMAGDHTTLNEEGLSIGGRMYLLAYLFPALPSAVLVKVAQGEADVTIEDDKVIIKYTDTWTPSEDDEEEA